VIIPAAHEHGRLRSQPSAARFLKVSTQRPSIYWIAGDGSVTVSDSGG